MGLAFSPPVAGETYTYGDTGRLTGVIYDDGSSITYSYDNNGNLLLIEQTAANVNTPPPPVNTTSYSVILTAMVMARSGDGAGVAVNGLPLSSNITITINN